jgi:hypothetical protein
VTCTVVTTSTVNTAVAGIYTVTYSATDVAGNVATPVVRTVTVNPAPVITTGAGQVTSVGRNFIVINGGLNAADHVFYTPTAAGTTFFGGVTTFLTGEYVTFTGTVDAIGSVSATSMSVYPKVTFVGVLANAQVGTVYPSINLLVTGTTPFTVGASGVPMGMSISPTGVLSGTPTTEGTSTITLSATDGIGNTGTAIVTIVVTPAPVVTPPPTYTSTGVKVDAKSTIASYNAVTGIMTAANGAVLRITPSTKVILNNGAKLSSVGVRVQYKGLKNTDGSVTVSQIEVK